MKIANYIILLWVLMSINADAQRNDNVWPLGSFIWGSNDFYSLDFASGSPDTLVYQRKMKFFITNSSISDSAGSLQFYTNGVWIANREHDTLYNSSNFNTGFGTQYYLFGGMGLCQSATILPFDATSNLYYLIYMNVDTFTLQSNISDAQPLSLRYSVVDMNLDSSRGGIVNGNKNLIAINDTLLLGRITACKHANGRDWWVVVHKYFSDVYYKLLFTPYGISGPFAQSIGPILLPKLPNGVDTDIDGMAAFSPDGTKYAQVGPSNDIHLMDFDRCTGMFSNYLMIDLPDTTWSLGCSFSPNSRFLYTNTYLKAYQFDTQDPDIELSKETIAVFDGHIGWSGYSYFFLNQLGSDGKIYLSTFSGNRQLHLINFPDSSGLSCNFVQHGFDLPQNNGGNVGLPNYPNYRLGPLYGSGCDTITSLNVPTETNLYFQLVPNPNNGNFSINYQLPSNRDGELQIFNVLGTSIYKRSLPKWSAQQQLMLGDNLDNGFYYATITSGKNAQTIKMVLIK